ncbi:hypothetical protein CBM2589_B230095 [Cupriavidus taiwanensis]|uniref:Uncharacterized protein n=1 Tax=Cupriavidus taiwanensis TaxID=164546 RepID=A0A375BQN8_9BURK|nr:hypothetical protein CBM2589_B230095 [Cupriavidus taiwanensis]
MLHRRQEERIERQALTVPPHAISLPQEFLALYVLTISPQLTERLFYSVG